MVDPPASPSQTVELSALALANGLLPLVVINLCYLISATVGHIPLCFPYLEGCTSISAAGRYGLTYFLFKGTIIPAGALVCLYWWLCARWLKSVGEDSHQAQQLLSFLGNLAGVFLILYAVFLGSPGDFYSFMRRFGVTVFFGCSGLTQLILLQRLYRLKLEKGLVLPAFVLPGKMLVAMALLVVGLASIPVKNFVADADAVANAVEWNFALLMQCFYLLTWRAWKFTGFTAQLSTKHY